MKSTAKGRHTGSRNYTEEFREAVVAEANNPNRSIAEVARVHGLNANMVGQWRRRSLEIQRTARPSCVELLPVDVIDLPRESGVTASPLHKVEAPANDVTPTSCEIEIEIGKRRVFIRGMAMDRAEQFLRDCLK